MTGGMFAARLAALPLLDLMTAETDWQSAAAGVGSWEKLDSLERVEVYQATGMVIGALDISPADALARLRAHAIARGLTASDDVSAVGLLLADPRGSLHVVAASSERGFTRRTQVAAWVASQARLSLRSAG